jgi:hypothetical protein
MQLYHPSSVVVKARALDDSDGMTRVGNPCTRRPGKKLTQSSKSLGKNALSGGKPKKEVEDPTPSQGSVRDRLLNKPNMNIVKKDQRTTFEAVGGLELRRKYSMDTKLFNSTPDSPVQRS